MNDQKPVPSDLLNVLMQDLVPVEQKEPASVHVKFLKVVFDLQEEEALKITILFKASHSDGTIVQEARYCRVPKEFSPMDVMEAIATGQMPPPWAWPHIEEGFV